MARVFSGIQPTGEIHIGNYLGAIRNWVALGETHGRDAIFCVVNYHAMTIPYQAQELAQRSLDAALVNMAAGLDPSKVSIFVQSQIPEHTELAWILTTQTPLGDLYRMTQFKDKSARQESVGAGLLLYPVLMAADILLYKATQVPVGEDQIQHLELAREIARRFNHLFGETFPEPQALLDPNAPRVRGIDGVAKMSKSAGNTIGLLEAKEQIWEKLRTAPTDKARVRRADPGEPTRCLIYSYHTYFTEADGVAAVEHECRRAGIGCTDCKYFLFLEMQRTLNPIQERAAELRAHPEVVRGALQEGAAAVRPLAQATIAEVRAKVGIVEP